MKGREGGVEGPEPPVKRPSPNEDFPSSTNHSSQTHCARKERKGSHASGCPTRRPGPWRSINLLRSTVGGKRALRGEGGDGVGREVRAQGVADARPLSVDEVPGSRQGFQGAVRHQRFDGTSPVAHGLAGAHPFACAKPWSEGRPNRGSRAAWRGPSAGAACA